MDIWAELATFDDVRIHAGRYSANVSISMVRAWPMPFVRFSARLRTGETLEAMVRRAITEVRRRAAEGMPPPTVPSPKRQRERKIRDLMTRTPDKARTH